MIARHPSLAIAPAALAVTGVLAAVPLLGQGPAQRPLAALAGLAIALYAAALGLPWAGVLPWALGLLGVEYLASLELGHAGLDTTAPAYGTGLLLSAELGWLGLEARRGAWPWPGRALAIGLVAAAGALLGAPLLLVAALPLPGGAPLTALGAAAAIAVAACLAWLGRRPGVPR